MPDTAAPTRALTYTAAGVALIVTTVVYAGLAGIGWSEFVGDYTFTNLVIGLAFLLPGAVIRWFQPRNRIGTLLAVSGLGALGTAAAAMLLRYGLDQDWPVVALRSLATVYIGAWQLGIDLCFSIALLLFPTQRLLSPRWRPVLWLTVAGGVYQLGTGILSSARIYDDERAVSIVSLGVNVEGHAYNDAMGLLNVVLTIAAIVGMVLRYRGGDDRVKRQLLWLLLALIVFTVANGQRLVTGYGPIMLLLTIALVPVAFGVAIVRYELFDIRLVVARAVTYVTTVAAIVGAYAGLVAVLTLIISDRMQRGIPVGAALVVAFAFNPVRIHLQNLTDRAFYGSRADPAGTARHVAGRLQESDEVAAVLDRAAAALKMPWMALDTAPDGARLASVGAPGAGTATSVDLVYQATTVGRLHLELRRGETSLHPDDRDTLDLICTPLAIALHATSLSEQLRQARAATVEAAAFERVRLQRELHDGLGPTLASIAFRVDAAGNVLDRDSGRAHLLMGEVGTDLRAVIDDIRRIVYGLRPIELDDLGLIGAVRQQVATTTGVAVEVVAPADLPDLSPAVELAAYRIIMEAVTNVARHSTAEACTVTVAVNGELCVTVIDDGAPPDVWRPGVGLRSIRERAEELGGTAAAGPAARGWTVRVALPLRTAAPNLAEEADLAAEARFG